MDKLVTYGMKQNHSKKHHYLPRKYLKGFTNSEDNFFVYDKKADKIFSTSPDDAFFENKLNTVTLPNGHSSDFLERIYTDIENQSWNSLDIIRCSAHNHPISPKDKANLFLFLLFLYWRLPRNIESIEKLSGKFFSDDKELDYFKLTSKNGNAVPKELKETIVNSPAFKKVAKTIVPFAPFFKDKNWWNKLGKWRFLYTMGEKNWFIVGDNPIITRGVSDHDPLNCLKEFIFPVSGKILLINVDSHPSQLLPSKFFIEYNAAIIKSSQRFVACQDENFLKALIKYYKVHVRSGKTDDIILNLFKMLEETEKEQ